MEDDFDDFATEVEPEPEPEATARGPRLAARIIVRLLLVLFLFAVIAACGIMVGAWLRSHGSVPPAWLAPLIALALLLGLNFSLFVANWKKMQRTLDADRSKLLNDLSTTISTLIGHKEDTRAPEPRRAPSEGTLDMAGKLAAELGNDLLKLLPESCDDSELSFIMRFLEPLKAAALLMSIPPERRSSCVSKFLETSKPIMGDFALSRVLEIRARVSDFLRPEWTDDDGPSIAATILERCPEAARTSILGELGLKDEGLALRISSAMFLFEDLILIDDRGIQKILRETDAMELAQALRDAPEEIQEKIFRNLSKRAEALLKEDMEYMGPIAVHTAEKAREGIVSRVRDLEKRGEIILVVS